VFMCDDGMCVVRVAASADSVDIPAVLLSTTAASFIKCYTVTLYY
jgi:hypothetical protein